MLATLPASAIAQGAQLGELSDQKLDRVDVIERRGATNVALDIDSPAAVKPWVATDYPAVGVPTSAFTACENTSTRGMYCLDGNMVRRWPEPERPGSGEFDMFSCANTQVFGFDRDNICTAMTVDLGGNVWIAGKKKSRFSLFKLAPRACTQTELLAGAKDLTVIEQVPNDNATYCAREYASGRPLLIDLSVVDGDVAEAFPHGPGVIGVEERREVTFFPDVPQGLPIVIGAGRAWGLGGGEQLQAAALLQKPLPSNSRNWVVVTTSIGRLLSRDVPYPPATPGAVINHTPVGGTTINLVAPTPPSCSTTPLTALYDVRTSVKTRATFISDRRGCRLLSLKSNIDTVGNGSLAFISQELIASTTPQSNIATLTAAPEGVSIAPGIKVNLKADCGFTTDALGNMVPKECGIVPDGPNDDETIKPAASLRGVKIDSTASGLTVFQIQNIADCRYLAYGTVGECTPAQRQDGSWIGAIVKPDGNVAAYPADYLSREVQIAPLPEPPTTLWFPRNPETLYLDVSKLMPPEVTKVTTLPRMLLSPRYRALPDTNLFDALFGITDDGVRFRETWLGKFELGDLIGFDRKLGCNDPPLINPVTGQPTIDPVNGPPLDMIVTLSERFTTVGGIPNGGRQHTDMLVNTFGCDPLDPPISGARWSLYVYGIKLAAERLPDANNPGQYIVRYPDSIFAKLVLSLFTDLGKTIDEYLQFDRDGGNGVPPITASAFSTLRGDWVVTEDKLRKCVESSTEPLNSTEIRACNSFDVQFAPFRQRVEGLMLAPGAIDPANRIGEVKSRLEVFRYVYEEQFKPSIPDQGFVDGLYE